jgi:hypothetical protein
MSYSQQHVKNMEIIRDFLPAADVEAIHAGQPVHFAVSAVLAEFIRQWGEMKGEWNVPSEEED